MKPEEATAQPATLTLQQALWLELMQFYIREAWLLDERKFKEWLDLFTDDVLYFMPRRKNVPRRELHRELTPLGDLAIFEEDKRYLEMRVARLDTGMAWAEEPPSRTRHLIGNLEVSPRENGEVEARTAFLVYRSHLETDAQLLSGYREDLLRKPIEAWKVARRTIVLDANVLLDKKSQCVFVSRGSIPLQEGEDVGRPFRRLSEGRPVAAITQQHEPRIGNMVQDRDRHLERHHPVVAAVDQQDRRFDGREVRCVVVRRADRLAPRFDELQRPGVRPV